MTTSESADSKRLNDLRRALDAASIVVVTDAQGNIVFVNDNFCKISGCSSGELIGEMYNILNSEHQETKIYESLWKTVSSGNAFRMEFKGKSKQDQIYWVDTTIVPFLNEKGRPFQYISISRDITELKTTERELTRWKQRFDTATVVAKQVLYDYNIATGKNVWGGAYEKIFGYNLKELKNDTISWLDFIHLDDRGSYHEAYKLALKEKTTFHHGYRVCHKNQSYIFVEEDGRILYDEENNPERMIGFIVDVSERKKLEKITSELPRRIINAQEKEKERIALDIHDDLGQSLIGTKMLITFYLQEKEFTNEKVQMFGKELLEQLNGCIEKARKVSYGLVPPQLKLLGLAESIKEMIKRVNAQNNISINFSGKNVRNLNFSGDEINIYRIVQEALNNILKHAKASKVDISMECIRAKLLLTIVDNGQGFDKKAGKRKQNLSRGLGLTVMRERAKLLGGKISIDSQIGSGTMIKVNIPLERVKDE